MQIRSKSRIYISILLLLFLFPLSLTAQENAPEGYAFLTVDLWPDYDRPELLVLISGGLPPETPLPVLVTLPLPENASINAVARVDSHGMLVDDFEYTVENGTIQFLASDLAFRVEYYQPFQSTTGDRSIDFSWTAPYPIQQFLITVQEPSESTNFTLSQEISQVQRNSDGLRYHILPVQTLLAGQETGINIGYSITEGGLSVDAIANPVEAPAETTAVPIDNSTWWLYGLGTVMLIFSLAMIGSGVRDQMKANRLSKPQRKRGKYCSNCNQLVSKGDKFCGNCGTAL